MHSFLDNWTDLSAFLFLDNIKSKIFLLLLVDASQWLRSSSLPNIQSICDVVTRQPYLSHVFTFKKLDSLPKHSLLSLVSDSTNKSLILKGNTVSALPRVPHKAQAKTPWDQNRLQAYPVGTCKQWHIGGGGFPPSAIHDVPKSWLL